MAEPSDPNKTPEAAGAALKHAIDRDDAPVPPAEPMDADFHPPDPPADHP